VIATDCDGGGDPIARDMTMLVVESVRFGIGAAMNVMRSEPFVLSRRTLVTPLKFAGRKTVTA
jgi:hypothetical protein